MRITGRAARGPLVATVELSLCHDAASEAADSSKPGFHRQMISIAAAITIPVTNPVKQENSSRSLRTTLMAASPCGPWSILRAQRTPLPWRKSDLVESTANLFQAYFATTLSVSRFVAKTWPAFRSSWQESGRAVPSRGIRRSSTNVRQSAQEFLALHQWRVTQQAAISQSSPSRPPRGPSSTSRRPTRSGQSRPRCRLSMQALASPLRRLEFADRASVPT